MKTTLVLLLTYLIFSFNNLTAQPVSWAEKIAGTSTDYSYNIFVDDKGYIYVAGSFSSATLSLNNSISLSNSGANDAYVAKYNNSGKCLWAEKIAGTGNDYAFSIVVDTNGNVYVAGNFVSSTLSFNNSITISNNGVTDGFIAKYNSSGTCQWAQKIGGSNNDDALSVICDSQNNIYIAGCFSSSSITFNNGTTLSNSGSYDAFFAKYNSNGTCQWAYRIYGDGDDRGYSIKVDESNNAYITGKFESTTLYFNNSLSLTKTGNSDGFITKYNSSGTCQWVQKIAGSGIDEGNCLVLDNSGNIIVGGNYTSSTLNFNNGKTISNSGSYDAFIAKYNNSGLCQWAQRIGGSVTDYLLGLATDIVGNVYTTGQYNSSALNFNNSVSLSNSGNYDAYIAKYSNSGVCVWAEKIAGTQDDYGLGIATDVLNDVYVTGVYTSQTLNFGNSKSLTNSGNFDVYIAKYTYSENTIWSWGANPSGQLGDGSTSEKWSPIQTGSNNDWTKISTRNGHTLAIKSDGTLWSWGYNSNGQLGDGTTTSKSTPTMIGTATDWADVSAGHTHSIALKSDGTLWAWGNNNHGQIGDGTNTQRTSPVKIGSDNNWIQIESGAEHNMAIKSNGTIWSWGWGGHGQLGDGSGDDKKVPTQIGSDNKWSQVSCGYYFTLAIKKDSSLWAWGNNHYGELGDGTNTWRYTPVRIGLENKWKRVECGHSFTLAIKIDNTLWAWGDNSFGMLGDDTHYQRSSPSKIGNDSNWKVFCTGYWHSIAIKNDGSLWTWGRNENGQLGDGTNTERKIPTKIDDTKLWNSICGGGSYTVALVLSTYLPIVSIMNTSEITSNEVKISYNVSENGDASVTSHGVCWSITQNPSLDENTLIKGSGNGEFTSTISNLSPNTTYFVRAYATNDRGTVYSDQVSFTTLSTIPSITTTSITNITENSASSGGNITSNGGADVTIRGVCWSTSQNPTTSNSKTTDGSGNGSFTSSIIGLNPNITYYVRAYATNSVGTAYGEERTFTTLPTLPTLTTTNITNITSNSASSGGNITNDGGANVTARGVCWSTSQNPTTSNSKTSDGNGNGSFTSSINGLNPNTTYYVRAYATNSVGTAYSEEKSFTTLPTIPTLTTTNITTITSNSASSGGNITSNGGANVTARGVCWSTTQNPTTSNIKTTDGSGNGLYTSSINGLNPNTTYYVRAYATNSVGTAYGEEKSFTTLPTIPTLTTTNITSITSNSASSGGNITSNGGANVTVRGVCWSTTQNPTTSNIKTTDGSGNGLYTSSINGLNPNTTYYVRAYAINSVGTAYGEEKSFTTLPTIPTLTTTNITTITSNSASSGGNITSNGGANVTTRGVCWSTTQNPTTSNSKTTDGSGNGSYTSSINGLNPNTTYYVRAYAINSVGTAYGDERIFTTLQTIPTLSTTIITNITTNSASSGGNITNDGGAPVTARGVCWSTSQNPTISNSKTTDGNGTGSFTSSITGLSSNTTYYVRAYATNAIGIAYGEERVFTTLEFLPVTSSWDYTDFTGNNSTIVLLKEINPKIDDRNFMKGDAVGVFFTRDGNLVCAGYQVWNNANMAITVWGDNTETLIKDGFATSENYLIKVWDGQLGRELNAEYTYSSGNPYYTVNGFSIFGAFKGVSSVTHSLYIKSGWNLISSYVLPPNDSLEVIFNLLKNKLTILKNNAGQVYIPSFDINSIGKWSYKQAYQAYMSSADTLKITGNQIKPENEKIVINSGWNLVAYLRNSAKDIAECLTTLTEDNSLTIAKNNAGQVYIPSFDINSIGNMLPGQGYQMYLSKKDSLIYPANSLSRAGSGNLTPMPKYLISEYKETGNSSVAILKTDLPIGDEIGVYNQNDELIGSGVVHNGYAAVTVWGDNDQTKEIDGAFSSEKLKVKSYNVKTGRLSDVLISDLVDFTNGEKLSGLNYKKDALYFAKATVENNKSTISLNVRPNPASEIIEIELETPDCKASELKLYSIDGKLISDLTDKLSDLSGRTISQNISSLTQGEYTVILTCGNERAMRKVVVVR